MRLKKFLCRLLAREQTSSAWKREMLMRVATHGEPLIILEAGAAAGIDTKEFAELLTTPQFFHPQNMIYAFEPVAQSYQALRRTVLGLSHVVTLPIALGTTEKTQDIYQQ